MGISGFLSGLAHVAGNAAPMVASAVSAKQNMEAQGLQQQREQMLQLYSMQLQQRAAERAAELNASVIGRNQAQTAAANALAGQRNLGPMVSMKPVVGADNTYQNIITRAPSSMMQQGGVPSPSPAAAGGGGFDPSFGASNLPSVVGGPKAQQPTPSQVSPLRQGAPTSGSPLVRATGIAAPVKAVRQVKILRPDGSVAFVDPTNPTAGAQSVPGLKAYIPPQPLNQVTDAQGVDRWAPRSEAAGQPVGKTGGAGGAGGTAQSQQARLLAAIEEGQSAMERMRVFEDKYMRGGRLQVGFGNAMGGKAGEMSTQSGPMGLVGTAADFLMKKVGGTPADEYQQYLRDARLMGRAEQLMAARGGSEAMAHANADLAKAPANATLATVQAARRSRAAMFGKQGGAFLALTPDQLARMGPALDALKEGDDASFSSAIKQGAQATPAAAAPPGAAPSPSTAEARALIEKFRSGHP
jgi:hypothetical protein